MDFQKLIRIFHDFAYAHPDIAHRDDTNPSFFTSDIKMTATLKNEARTGDVLVQMMRPTGRLAYGSEVFNKMLVRIRILKKGSSLSDAEVNDTLQQETEALGLFMTGWLNDLYERGHLDTALPGFDLNLVQTQPIGPVCDQYYGTEFSMELSTIPFNVYNAAGRATLLQSGIDAIPPDTFIDVFRSFAHGHPLIAHRADSNPSLFTTDERMAATLKHEIRTSDYMLQVMEPTGRLEYGSELFHARTGLFRVLCKGGDLSEETRNKGIQTTALDIAFTLAAWMHDLFEESPYSGAVAGFDLNSVSYSLVGPVCDKYYGAELRYTCKTVPFNIYDVDGRNDIMAEGLSHRIFGTEFALEFE